MKSLLRTGAVALAAASIGSLTLVPASSAHAQADCLRAEYQASVWSTGPDGGGFVASIAITNICDVPVDGWTLRLTLPAGHTFTQGWSASWTASGDQLTATDLGWNQVINPGGSITVGFVGAWAGAYQDPVTCTINGRACGGGPVENEPPTVRLTQPAGGLAGITSPCPFILAAEATDPDGTVDRVEFHVNNVLVGTDATAPYRIGVGLGGLPPPTPQSEWVAFARAHDDGAPSRSSDSPPVTFRIAIGDPLPETIFACSGSLELRAGSSEAVRFAVFSASVTQVNLTVTGDPGVTVTPTTVTVGGNSVVATVSSAAGSAGATATVTATAGNLRPASILVKVT